MIKSSMPVRYDELNLAIVKALFTRAGDTLTNPLSNMGALNTKTYKRRHIAVSGSFDIIGISNQLKKRTKRYTQTELSDNGVSRVWPNRSTDSDRVFNIIDEFEVISNIDNSAYYCVVPNKDGFLVKHTDITIDNKSITLEKGNLYFSNVDLKINNEVVTAYTPIAVINNNIDVSSDMVGNITKFYVEEAGK